jgi:hypothetical protein
MRLYAALLLAVLAGTFSTPAPAANDKGWFGLAMSIDVAGPPLSPKLRSITAERDLILEAEGIVESLHLKVVRGSDPPHAVSLIATPKPVQ